MPIVAHLFRAKKRGLPMEEMERAQAVANLGFSTCRHARLGSNRQVLIVDQETLDAMNLEPGIIRENITTQGLNVNGMTIGERLRFGMAVLEVSMVCTPCDQLEKVRLGLRRELYGRRGMLCRVIADGEIKRGDSIERVSVASS